MISPFKKYDDAYSIFSVQYKKVRESLVRKGGNILSKISEKEIALLSAILSVQKIKEKNLREECQEVLGKYSKIRDILMELNEETSVKIAKKGKQK